MISISEACNVDLLIETLGFYLGCISHYASNYNDAIMTDDNWATRARAKRENLASLIPPEWRLSAVPSIEEGPNVILWSRTFLAAEERDITESEPLSIIANIQAQIWSAEEVVRAFCHRAAIAHQLTNCLTEILFDEAIFAAQELDQQYRTHGVLQGPLHGLPMSFMDRYRIAGTETSAGYVSWLGPRETRKSESLIVRHMRRLGAVPFCKTTVPQSMMLAATDNNIFGRTLNPFARGLSAGGAAGGEGALQAMNGSPFGWATEIAGSARIPAVCNGLFALRACAGRLPTLGIASSSTTLPICGMTPAMISSSLPMLQHISRLVLGCKAFQEDSQWLELPWRDSKCKELERRRPRFAILHHDNHVRPQPPVQRALNFVREALSAHAYEVVEWDPPPHSPAVETLFRLIGADGGSEIRAQIKKSGEPPVKGLQSWYREPGEAAKVPVEQFWSWSQQRTDYNTAYHAYWMKSELGTSPPQQVDGVIMPVTANAASYEHGLSYFGESEELVPNLWLILAANSLQRHCESPGLRRRVLSRDIC